MRKIHPGLLVLISTCLILVGCSSAPFQNQDPGWVLMRYATNEEKGFFTLEPVDLGEEAEIVQDVFPGSMDEMRTEILKAITSEELPEPAGTYQGSTLTWEWYQEETQIPDLGPFDVTLLIGLAADDSSSYFVALVTLPELYEQESEKLSSVFFHTLYAFSPLD